MIITQPVGMDATFAKVSEMSAWKAQQNACAEQTRQPATQETGCFNVCSNHDISHNNYYYIPFIHMTCSCRT